MGYSTITQSQVDQDPRQRTSTSWGIRRMAALGTQIAAELVHKLDADGQQLRVVKLTDGQRNAQGQRLSAEVNPARRVSAFSLQPFRTSPAASAP
jgi:hypothetical protein